MKDREDLEKSLKMVLDRLSQNFDSYDYYNNTLFNGEDTVYIIFRNYISAVEGSPCCADKTRYIVKRIKKALEERKNQLLTETYQEYKERGGNLGGLNESNTDLNSVCYWCPKTIKDTDTAISLYYSLLNVPKYIQINLNKEKIKWQKLKEWLEYRTAENGVFDNYDSLAVEDNLILDKMQELEGEDE